MKTYIRTRVKKLIKRYYNQKMSFKIKDMLIILSPQNIYGNKKENISSIKWENIRRAPWNTVDYAWNKKIWITNFKKLNELLNKSN